MFWVGRTCGGHRVQPSAQSRSNFKITSCCWGLSPTEFWKSAVTEISQPPWAAYSRALLIHCETSFPLYPVGISIVTIWICSFSSFHCHLQEESVSVFSTTPHAWLKTAIGFFLRLLFSRLNKPSLMSFLKVLPSDRCYKSLYQKPCQSQDESCWQFPFHGSFISL